MKQYEYDAFISYRHTEPDKYAAELLHRQMEAFRLPGKLSRTQTDGRKRINRVFRDKDELPLTDNLEDPIMRALASSEFLIVICSPRIRQSLWCKKEIETFIGMHGREKVLAVLIEGEPSESFPDELLYREETVTEADGTTHTERIPVEPLAADIRGKDKRAVKKALKTELLRLLAPMFSVNYDDLRQRHRERRLKRILAASLGVGAVCLAFGLVSTVMTLRIRSQKARIEAQAEEILQQNEAIRQQNELLLSQQALGLAQEAQRLLDAGDRREAVKTAYSALTSSDGNPMPYTPEAQFVLTESLAVYDNGYSAKPLHQMTTVGIIDCMKQTVDRSKLVTFDNSNCLTVWDTITGNKLGEIRDLENYAGENSFQVLGNDRIVYLNGDSQIVEYDIDAGQAVRREDQPFVREVYADPEGKYLILHKFGEVCILDGETFEVRETYSDRDYNRQFFNVSGDGRYLAFQEVELEEDRGRLQIWDLETGEKYPPLDLEARSVKEIRYRDGAAYVMLNEHNDDYINIETTVIAFEIGTGHILWEQVLDTFGNGLMLPSADGAENMLVVGTFEAFLLRLEDGSEAAVLPYGTNVAGCAVFIDTDAYVTFTRSGEYHVIMSDIAEDYYVVGRFISHSQNVKKFMVAGNGFLVLPYQDNKVTYYTFSQGEDLTPYSGEVQVPETEAYQGNEARQQAEKMGLVKAALASCVFYDPEKTTVFVYYTDGTLEIYRTADMSLVNTMTDVESLQHWLGTDSGGNIYIGGYSYGYMLDPQCRPLAVMEGLSGVDAENGRVFLKSDSEGMCTVPVYSVEELLAKAAEDVL